MNRESINEVRLSGNLTKDPEGRYTQSGAMVTRFTVAVTELVPSGGEPGQPRTFREQAHFINVECWNDLAEVAGAELRKGSAVSLVEGALRTYSFDGDDGQRRYGWAVRARDIQVEGRSLKPERRRSAAAPAQAAPGGRGTDPRWESGHPPRERGGQDPPRQFGGPSGDPDDLPFE
jgi:single-strand DNA-binding protein